MWGRRYGDLGSATLFVFLATLLSACFHESNHPPTANAGANVSTSIATVITLDGSASSDVDGDRLSYHWEITGKPENSAVALSDDKVVNPVLELDVVGLYTIQLIVSDGKLQSKPDFISITTFNEKPVAQIIETSVRNGSHYIIGDTISVDAGQSSDPENETLFYNWEITVKPDTSQAVLSNNTAVNPFFIVDQPGHYILHLIVSDGSNLSEPEMIIFEIEQPRRKTNTKPFAEAGPDQPLFSSHTTIQLDGSASYDVENDALNFQWELIYKPIGSVAILSNANSVAPSFFADVPGSYVAKLIVSDIDGDSHLDTIVVTPHEDPQLACGDCHNNVITSGKPQNHLLTYDDCFQCHFIDKWMPSKGIVHFHSHAAKPAQCEVCHNGVDANGKVADHIVTNKDCNYCHKLNGEAWVPALSNPVEPEFSHSGIFSGCIACHDNLFQRGKPEGHMPVSNRCFACHTTKSWVSDLHLEHTQVFNQCSLCHDGNRARGKVVNHVNTTNQCDGCHLKISWQDPVTNRQASHPDFFEPCSVCHDKPDEFSLNKHLPTSIVCEKCHNTVAWKPAIIVDHAEVIGGCVDCHNNAKGKAGWKNTIHINTSNNCEACHGVALFKPKIVVDHNEVVGACVDCHNGKIATGQKGNHLPTTDDCEACHATTQFMPAIAVDHRNILGDCFDCHNNKIAPGKGLNHLSVTNSCIECHDSSVWIPVKKVAHDAVIGDCVSCHNGVLASGQKPGHVLSSDRCEYCHEDSSWTRPLAKLEHSQVLSGCEFCHAGNSAVAAVKPAGHVAASDGCGDAGCHSTVQWTVLKSADHYLQTTACSLCHDGLIATGKPVDHLRATNQCESCHENNFWIPLVSINHQSVVGDCVDCHNNVIAQGKKKDHIIVLDDCAGCHGTDSFLPVRTLDHQQYVGSCNKCHDGVVAGGKPSIHYSTTDLCEACHSPVSFVPVMQFDHTQAIDTCTWCHDGVVASTRSANHVQSNDECHECHEAGAGTWLKLKSDVHFKIDLPCTDCHVAPNQHLVVGVNSQCESCHIVASWENPARTLIQ